MSRTGGFPGRRWGSSPRAASARCVCAGHAAIVPEREALTEDHWFDLASVSKVIATTTMILRLADEGRLDLDAPLTTAIPDLRQYDVANAPERRLTFRDCLAHRTFLPAVEPIYTYGDDPDRLRAFVLQREWRHGPPVYSDINFILLGIAIERITGQPLIGLAARRGAELRPAARPGGRDRALPVARARAEGRGARRELLRAGRRDGACRAVRDGRGRARFRGWIARRQRRVAGDARCDPYAASSNIAPAGGTAVIPAGPAATPARRARSGIPDLPAPGCGSISTAAWRGRY